LVHQSDSKRYWCRAVSPVGTEQPGDEIGLRVLST
jgi:hypothetical protein